MYLSDVPDVDTDCSYRQRVRHSQGGRFASVFARRGKRKAFAILRTDTHSIELVPSRPIKTHNVGGRLAAEPVFLGNVRHFERELKVKLF